MPVETVTLKAILLPLGMLVPAFGHISAGSDQLRSLGPETVSCHSIVLKRPLFSHLSTYAPRGSCMHHSNRD